MKPASRINDFVVKFANVNGSGSASANALFAKAILKMGVPVAARNIFEAGWRGRRVGIDLMVGLNLETWDQDVTEIEPGGYLFYDSTKPMPRSKFRDDVTVIGVPLMEMCNAEYTDTRQRQLFKNIMCLGGLARLLAIDPADIEGLLAVQFKGKEPLLDANRHAFRLGYDYVDQNIPAIGLKVERRDNVGNRIFIDGNAAAALGAVYGGATVCAWYPITPSSSLAEAFAKHCAKHRVDLGGRRILHTINQA
jgi:2-oxoglutarate ferredoxin oxidoreductase subunit alpha